MYGIPEGINYSFAFFQGCFVFLLAGFVQLWYNGFILIYFTLLKKSKILVVKGMLGVGGVEGGKPCSGSIENKN